MNRTKEEMDLFLHVLADLEGILLGGCYLQENLKFDFRHSFLQFKTPTNHQADP